MGGIGLGDPCQLQVAGHPVAHLAGRERRLPPTCNAAGEDILRLGRLQTLPLAQGFRDIGGQIHHAIDVPFTVVNADGALREIDGRPGSAAHFAYPEATPQHQQKQRAVSQGIDDAKERDDLVLSHGAGEVLGQPFQGAAIFG